MADSPISIRIQLEGIEPNDRFQAAVDELAAAAAELVHAQEEETSGFALPLAVPDVLPSWSPTARIDPKTGSSLLDYEWIAARRQ